MRFLSGKGEIGFATGACSGCTMSTRFACAGLRVKSYLSFNPCVRLDGACRCLLPGIFWGALQSLNVSAQVTESLLDLSSAEGMKLQPTGQACENWENQVHQQSTLCCSAVD